MKPRQLALDDVVVVPGHLASKNRQRVYVHLKNCSFVSHTFWIVNFNSLDLSFQAVAVLTLERKLKRVLKALKEYVEVEPKTLCQVNGAYRCDWMIAVKKSSG